MRTASKKKPQNRNRSQKPKRLRSLRKGNARSKGSEKPLIIDGRKEKDKSLLPAKVNGGSLQRAGVLTLDRLAEDIGGRSEFVNMCRLSDAPEAIEFVRKCEVEGEDLRLEVILDSMGVKAGKILESVVPALYNHQGQVAKIINAMGTPGAMLASVKSAKLIGMEGFADRKLQLDIAGLVPKTGGPTIIGQMNVSGGIERPEATYQGAARIVEEEEDGEDDNS